MPSFPGFIGGSAPSESVIATSERTVNWYVERVGTEGPQHTTALYPVPGQHPWITAAGITAAASYATQVLQDGASAYWRLNEASGLVAADQVGGAPGTISGGVTLGQPGALADGATAMAFDGTTGKIVTAASLTLPVAFTVEAWITVTAAQLTVSFPTICSTRVAGESSSIFFGGNDVSGKLIALTVGGVLFGTRPLGDGQWHHCVLVVSAGVATIYVDGLADATGAWPRATTLPATPVAIGYDVKTPGLWWRGALDEVAIYPVALTAAQVAAHYAARTLPPATTVLVDVNASAGLVASERAFVVIGAGLYEIFADATLVRRGTVTPGAAPAQLAYNGQAAGQLLVASGGNADLFQLSTNALTRVLTGEATAIGMLDEYFLALNATTGQLRLSNLQDGLTWDPTQKAHRSAQPDRWIGMLVNAPDLWLLGQSTGDVWYDAGTAPFPLAMRQGLTVQYGVVAPASLQAIAGQVFWLTSTREGVGLVVRSNGYDPQPVTTPEVANAIAGYARTASVRDAEALVYRMAGHTFYVLRFPSANATWQYDLTTGLWTELGSWNPARGAYDVWRPRMHLYAFERHLVGEAQTGTLSLLDVTYATESTGDPIRRLRRGPVLIQGLQRLPLRRFELVLEAGLGLVTGLGAAPVVLAHFSADGGQTWGAWRQAGAGRLGQYRTRVAFTRLGAPRLFVAEIVVSDPIPWRVLDALINNDATVDGRAA